MDWEEANTRCRELGTYSRLADINDNTENTAIKQFISSFDGNNNNNNNNNNKYEHVRLSIRQASERANMVLCYGQERPLQFANHNFFSTEANENVDVYRSGEVEN